MIHTFAGSAVTECRKAKLHVVLVEMSTGGAVGAALSSVRGSSSVFDQGYGLYGRSAQAQFLGADTEVLVQHGSVSAEAARAFAQVAQTRAEAENTVTLAVTGIEDEVTHGVKPSGLTYIAVCVRGRPPVVEEHVFKGDRTEVRRQAVQAALMLLSRTAASLACVRHASPSRSEPCSHETPTP